MLNRYEKIKTEVIDKLVEGAYELAPIQTRLDLVAQDFPLWDIERELEDLHEQLCNNEIYQKYIRLQGLLKMKKEEVEITKNLVRDYMINNDIKKIEWNDKIITVQNRQSIETEVEFLNEIPEEYIRTKKELDKVAAKKMYTENGVLIPGVKFIHKDNFSLKIKEVKNGLE